VDQLTSAYASSPLLFWIGGSLLIYLLATNALWLARSIRPERLPAGQWLAQAGRFLFYLGIPYLALGGWPRQPYAGLLSLEDIGIVGLGGRWPVIRWLEAVGTGLTVGLVAFLVLILAWAGARRLTGSAQLSFPSRPWWAILVQVLYLEAHWAFYRGALSVALDDLYAAVFWGLGVVYVEWALDPFWRQGWRQGSQAPERWLRAALALVIALLFFLTRNLWVCLGIHWLFEFIFWRLGRERTRAIALGDAPLP
jgi:hypothetical protein